MTSSSSVFLISIIFCLCSFTYANTCSNTSAASGCKQSSNFVTSVQSTIQALSKATSFITSQLDHIPNNDFKLSNGIHDCVELIDDSIDHLRSSINVPTAGAQCGGRSSPCTSISAALANQDTCVEGLDNLVTNNASVKNRVIEAVNPLKPMMAHLLTLVKSLPVLPSYNNNNNNYTTAPWFGNLINITLEEQKADITVALNGNEDYRTIMDAVNAAPSYSQRRFVIRIRRGVYKEHVEIPNHKPNLVLIGEGQGVTIITGDRSAASGHSTLNSATFVVGACGFMASYLTIQNTAGPKGGQAVALRSNAENLVFYKCTFSAYQDTLYARSGKQFFRECEIKGTVDFIFGDATAVFQLSKILVRKTVPGSTNTVTAQGRETACGTGYSFHGCSFAGEAKLDQSTRTYLGRPWRNYARTVVMKSFVGDLIDRQGWMDWDGRSALKTIYYGEYMNNGPGSNVRDRVRWPGVHVTMSQGEAMQFTVGRFIDGDKWLPATGVPYISGL